MKTRAGVRAFDVRAGGARAPAVRQISPDVGRSRSSRWWMVLVCAAFASSGALFAATAASLADAVEKKDVAAVRALIGDSNVNAAQPDGMTALHWAVRHDDLATAKALLAAKANPRA